MTNQVRVSAVFFMLMLLFACNGPTVPLSRQRMTVARHNAEKFPTMHGASENTKHDCNACHGGLDSFTQFSCLGCHAHERSANDQWHAGVEAYRYDSKDCYACHPTGVGEGAPSKHFPIGDGTPHAEAKCDDCHTAGDYKSFSCVECHDHEKSSMDTKHTGVSGYVYDSDNCLRCHPDGQGFDPAQHEKFFPIASGTHAGNKCNACHTKGDYQSFSCIDCHNHDQSPMSTAHSGVPSYAYASPNCLACHPKGQAFGAAEHTSFFPITSGAHDGFQCNECHTDGTNFAIYSCTGCHGGNHACSIMNSKHSSVSGYQCVDTSCFNCHPNGKH